MLGTVALVLVAWWIVGVALALVIGRFIALADAHGTGTPPPPRTGQHAGERHA